MVEKIRKIAIYGKGGIGKSMVSSNLSVALSHKGLKTAQIGCDPKADSVNTLMNGNFIETISEITRKYGASEESLLKAVYKGFNNIICLESGGPSPGQGCAGRGVMVALDLIRQYKLLEKFNVEFAIYDVLGDIVCGGFAQPIRHSYAEEVYIVTSGEYMSLYAANNIASSIKLFAEQGLNVALAGIIGNLRNIENEIEILENFSKNLKIPLIQIIPRSSFVQQAEVQGKTVIEALPKSSQSKIYFELANKIIVNNERFIPKPLDRLELRGFLKSMKI
jgi:nitrogenase iron protein NifH